MSSDMVIPFVVELVTAETPAAIDANRVRNIIADKIFIINRHQPLLYNLPWILF